MDGIKIDMDNLKEEFENSGTLVLVNNFKLTEIVMRFVFFIEANLYIIYIYNFRLLFIKLMKYNNNDKKKRKYNK